MKIGYFPGCSLHATAREYAESLGVITGPLDVEINEIDDWACCGATSAHATNHLLGVALPARTLALAAEQGHEQILAPCAACYSRLAAARRAVDNDPATGAAVEKAIGRSVGTARPISLVRLLAELAPKVREKAKRPLEDIKVACYYGCLLVRPPELNDLDDVEAPTMMETVVKATGAKPVSWNRRLDCCGGGFSLSRTSSVVRLSRTILEDARGAGADVLVVACPMCHSNLDFRQKAIARRSEGGMDIPVIYLSQLVGLALGQDHVALGLGRHFVSTASFISRIPGPREGESAAATEVG